MNTERKPMQDKISGDVFLGAPRPYDWLAS